jgi:hypothetical protein
MLVTMPAVLLKMPAAFLSFAAAQLPLRRSCCPSRNAVSASCSGRLGFHARRVAAHRTQHLHVAALGPGTLHAGTGSHY